MFEGGRERGKGVNSRVNFRILKVQDLSRDMPERHQAAFPHGLSQEEQR